MKREKNDNLRATPIASITISALSLASLFSKTST